MTTTVPLIQWQPVQEGDKPLLPEKCNARVATEGPRTTYYQCPNRPTTSRPMKTVFSEAPIAYPVCGTHRRVHDDAQGRSERGEVEATLRAAIASRFRSLTTGTKLDGFAELVEPIDLAAPRVSIPLNLLEVLLEAGKPVEEFYVNDLVAFIVRDRDRTRYQGVGRVKSIKDNMFVITDSMSGRRYKVPRPDIKRSKPKVER